LTLTQHASEVDVASVADTVIEICRTVFEDSQISVESSSETVEHWDSLGHMRLITALEERFGIELDVMEMAEVSTVQQLIAVVEASAGA